MYYNTHTVLKETVYFLLKHNSLWHNKNHLMKIEWKKIIKSVEFENLLQGKRANKAKKMIKELLENDTGEES